MISNTFAESVALHLDRSVRPGEPWVVRLGISAAAPVHVRVVRAPGDDPNLAVELMASIGVAPRKVGVHVPIGRDGVGVLAEVPREVTDLSFFRTGSEVWESLDAARTARDVRLFVAQAPAAERGMLEVRLADAPGPARPVLQVRSIEAPASGATTARRGPPTYAVPSFTEARDGAEGYRIRASLPAGRYRVFVTTGERGAVAAEPVVIVAGAETVVNLTSKTLATIRVALVGGIAVVRNGWELVARRLEGEAEVEGQGFVLRGLGRADADLHVPSGRYRVVARLDGEEGRPSDVNLEGVGVQASIDLQPTK